MLALLSLLLAVELDEEDDDPLVELDEASLDSDDVEDESLPSLESLVSLSLSLLLLVVLFENETREEFDFSYEEVLTQVVNEAETR